MNKRIKVLAISMVLLILGCMFTFTAYATGEVTPPADGVTPPAVDPNPTPDPEPVVPDPPVVDPNPPADPADPADPVVPENPGTGGEVVDPAPVPDTPVVEQPTSSSGGGYVDSYMNDDGYYYYDEDQMVNNIEDTAGSVSDYTDLYDTSDFDSSTLKESEWNDIKLEVSKGNSDAADFSAIKENKETEDDGEWIVYTGLVLIGLSLIGIMYFIIATATYKKKLKSLKRREQSQRSCDRARNDYGDMSEFPTRSDYNRRYQKNRYASPDSLGYAQRKRLNADTAEIDLPKKKYVSRH